jgi:hypothetical protein
MNEIVTKPNRDDIGRAVDEFDHENTDIEEALLDLFRHYPENSSTAHVLLKVTSLNVLYSTQIPLYSVRIPTILDVAHHIVNRQIDSGLRVGSPELIDRIARIQVTDKASRYYYSFATKYCSWHNPNSYPIFDSRALHYLCYLRDHGCLDDFRQGVLWDYPKFKRIVEQFREMNGLGEFTFKDIDKFLYLQGSRLLMGRGEREIKEDETILVPVPGQPDEMEWSVENYSSPEEAERSRRKFTDSAGWVRPAAEQKES